MRRVASADRASPRRPVPDAYREYVARRRAAEQASTARDDYVLGRISVEELEARLAEEVVREDDLDRARLDEATTPQVADPPVIRGPLCSDRMHFYEGLIWLVPREGDSLPPISGSGPENLMVVGAGLMGTIPFVGTAVGAVLCLLSLPWYLLTRAQKKRREAENKRLQEAALRDPDRPWGWKVIRCGPDPWSSVAVPQGWLPRLGLHHPTPDAGGTGRWMVEQIEPSKADAIAMASRACELLTY